MLTFIVWGLVILSLLFSHFASGLTDYLFAIFLALIASFAWICDIAADKVIKALKEKGE